MEGKVQGRLRTIDMLKGIAIFGLVMIHFVFVTSGTGEDSDPSPLFEFVYCYLFMFFIVSGYFYRPERGFCSNVKKRISQILVVYVACTVILTAIMFFYLSMTGYDLNIADLPDVIWKCLIGKTAFNQYGTAVSMYSVFEVGQGYYYLEIMMVAFIIFYAVADWALKDVKRTALTIFLLATVTCFLVEVVAVKLPFYAESGPLAAALMLIGAVLGKHKVVEFVETGWRTKRYWLIFAAMLVIGIIFAVYFPTGLRFNLSRYGAYGGWSAYTFLILACSCGYVLLVFSFLLSRIPGLSTIFTFLGEHTLAILVMHTFYGKLLVSPFCTFDLVDYVPVLPIAQGFAVAITAIILSIVTGYIAVKVRDHLKSHRSLSEIHHIHKA